MERSHFIQTSGCEWTLGWRALVDANADENLAQERKDAGDVVQTRDNCGLAGGLWKDGSGRDIFIIDFFGEVKRAVFVSKANRSTEQYRHRLVGTEQEPKHSSPYFGLDGVKALVRGLLVHVQGDRNMRSLAE